LEQTINADAAKRLTGITHFTNSISALGKKSQYSIDDYIVRIRSKWLKKAQDVTSDLQKHQISKDCAHEIY